jgi:two-component system, cell cycle sensor histidine kinase and response regulator CckA
VTPQGAPEEDGFRILLLDDERPIVEVGSRLLTMLGYHVKTFTRPADALDAFRAAPHDFDVVVSDLTMPGESGLDVAVAVHAIRPEIPVIVTTGNAGRMDQAAANAAGVRHVLQKPFDMQSLSRVVREALGK